jgi:hypothetical protein
MNKIANLESAAVVAFRDGESWPVFYDKHLSTMRQAEKYGTRAYYRLTFRLADLVNYGATRRKGQRRRTPRASGVGSPDGPLVEKHNLTP